MERRSKIRVFFLAATISMVSACGKKDDDSKDDGEESDQPSFLGQLNVDEGVNLKALPILDGSTSDESIILATDAAVDDTGAFSLELPTTFTDEQLEQLELLDDTSADDFRPSSWVFVLIDKKMDLIKTSPSERLSSIKSIVGIPDDEESMVNIPTADIVSGSDPIDLGSIGKAVGGFAISESTLADTATGLNRELTELKEIAGTDDLLRNAKNTIANYDAATGTYYSAEPFFIWNGDQADATGDFFNVAAYTIGGFGIYFGSNDSRVSLDSICSPANDPKHVAVEIVPPAEVVGTVDSAEVTYSPNQPMTNEDAAGSQASAGRYDCNAGTIYASGDTGSTEAASFNVGGGGFSTEMPAGIWRIKLDGQEAAAFDLAAANPNSAEGKPLVYVPSVKINTDDSDVINSLDIQWYRWNKSTNKFEQVKDLTVFRQTVTEGLSIDITDYSGTDDNPARVEENISVAEPKTGATYNVADWTQSFKIGSSADTTSPVAESVVIRYNLYGVNVRFDLR